MLAFLNLGLLEMTLIAVVAILIFGKRLPEVAGQAAGTVARLKRQFQDLRRETGIDREIWEARRAFEQAVPRDLENLPKLAERELEKAVGEADPDEAQGPPAPPASQAPTPESANPQSSPAAGAPSAPPPSRTPPAVPPSGLDDGTEDPDAER